MATKAQRRSQKAQKKERKRRRERLRAKERGTSSAKRLGERLGKLTPVAWDGELPEDVAIFNDAVFSELPTEAQEHATRVRAGLQAVCKRDGDSALQPLSEIPRRSVFSDWRLFLRGLDQWLGGDIAAAQETWRRLDPQRRPSRIAQTFVLSHRDDLTTLHEASRNGPVEIPPPHPAGDEAPPVGVDRETLYHAKLLRSVQVDRKAIRAARAIEEIPMVIENATVNPVHLQWLKEFTSQYQSIEPELVQRLHEITIRRAFCGVYLDVFRDAVRQLRGPRHDRKSRLLTYFAESTGPEPTRGEKALQKYLQEELPSNEELSPRLRNALRSQLHLVLAAEELTQSFSEKLDPFGMFTPVPDFDLAFSHFESAVDAYPANLDAWTGFQAVFRAELSTPDLTKDEREEILERQAAIHARWVEARPDDLEPRLELVDYLLEHDRSDEAKPHVDWLIGTRRDDPLANAMQWRFGLCEAMRCCRRKAWVPQAMQALDEAVKHWPAWLNQDWLPSLRAAIDLRGGVSDPIEIGKDGLSGACMMLGAAQRMRVPAAGLKPLREPIEAALKSLKELSDEELLRTASFFWDLHRTRLKYPAYRMHATKFLAELLARFNQRPKWFAGKLDSPHVRDALLVMANEGMLNEPYDLDTPKCFKACPKNHPVIAAALVTAGLRLRTDWALKDLAAEAKCLLDAAPKADTFYRHLYNQLGNDLESRLDQFESQAGQGLFGFFRSDDD
ncbi:MAG: hypothetical protein AAF802_04720 [Planctomycetota bacterium]